MKHVFKTVTEGMRVITGFIGLILCASEAADPAKQIYISLAGIALLILAALPGLFEGREGTWNS